MDSRETRLNTERLASVREDLEVLRKRLARGELEREEYQLLRSEVLADLTAEERAALSVGTPTPLPTAPATGAPRPVTPSGLGPSGEGGRGLRTSIPSLADLDLQPGSILLDQWKLVRKLGRGGFGAVFEAEELHLGERQAVKVLDPAMVAKEELLARFRREVSLMRRLEHPRIVRVFDYREDLSQLVALISMQLVAGGSVRQLLAAARARKAPVPLDLALEILVQTLEALAEAHSQGVIHRDVTPGNVLLAGGTAEELLAQPVRDPQVKLVDFGIAGLVERSELSRRSQAVGTAAYVAPEVLDPAAEITSAADVYGAGAMGYELLTGKLPLGRFAAPASLLSEISPALDALVTAMLAPDARQRPTVAAVLGVLRGTSVSARARKVLNSERQSPRGADSEVALESSQLLRPSRARSRRVGRVAVVGALLGVLALGGWLLWRPRAAVRSERQVPQAEPVAAAGAALNNDPTVSVRESQLTLPSAVRQERGAQAPGPGPAVSGVSLAVHGAGPHARAVLTVVEGSPAFRARFPRVVERGGQCSFEVTLAQARTSAAAAAGLASCRLTARARYACAGAPAIEGERSDAGAHMDPDQACRLAAEKLGESLLRFLLNASRGGVS